VNASLCYMCALNLSKASKYWKTQLDNANKKNGGVDLLALHSFVVKVSIFLQAEASASVLDPDVAELFSTYAKVLSEQGLFPTAAKYSRGESLEARTLRDRLYRSVDHQFCAAVLGAVPEFPFTLEKVITTTVAQPTQQAPVAADPTPVEPVAAMTQNGTSHVTQPTMPQVPEQHAAPQLPPGWIALQDPSSGMTYYANQTTGETTWEMPRADPAMPTPMPAVAQPTMQSHQVQSQQQQVTAAPANSTTPAKLASKYGDGFVTSASHPQLAQQYGNVGTSNPYTGAERPGTASVAPTQKAPVSGTLDPNQVHEVSPELKPVADGLMGIVDALTQLQLTGSDKRQFSEVQKNVAIFVKRLARRDIDPEVAGKVGMMIGSIHGRDYAGALATQTRLVNTDWKENKDWLKGMKFMIQLASKKL